MIIPNDINECSDGSSNCTTDSTCLEAIAVSAQKAILVMEDKTVTDVEVRLW